MKRYNVFYKIKNVVDSGVVCIEADNDIEAENIFYDENPEYPFEDIEILQIKRAGSYHSEDDE